MVCVYCLFCLFFFWPQATVGPCTVREPSAWNPVEHSKWTRLVLPVPMLYGILDHRNTITMIRSSFQILEEIRLLFAFWNLRFLLIYKNCWKKMGQYYGQVSGPSDLIVLSTVLFFRTKTLCLIFWGACSVIVSWGVHSYFMYVCSWHLELLLF